MHGRDHASSTQPQPQLDKAGPSQGTRSEYASIDANSVAMLNINGFSSLDNPILFREFLYAHYIDGDRGSTVVKVLCYKPEGRWFDPSWCQWIFR